MATDGKQYLIFSPLPSCKIHPPAATAKESDNNKTHAPKPRSKTQMTETTNEGTAMITPKPPAENCPRKTVEERVREMGIPDATIEALKRKTEQFALTAHLRHHHASRRLSLAPLLAVPEAKRQEIITTQGWMASTQATQWAILCSLARDLGKPVSPLARAIQKRLDAVAAQRPPWTTDTKNFATPEWIRSLLPSASDPYVLAALLAWTLGARVGDILKIRSESAALYQTFPQTVVHSFTIVEGKTVPHTGPYTVFLSTATPFNEELVDHVRAMATRPYLFLTAARLLEKDALEKAVEEAERKMHERIGGVDLRSLRRGGLSHLSAAGFSDEAVRTFSTHTSDAQLQLYLRAGRFNGARAREQEAMTRAQFDNQPPPS